MVEFLVGGNGLIHTHRQRTKDILYHMDIRYHISGDRIRLNMKWLEEHWPKIPFVLFILWFIVMMILEYYEGNCRLIGVDMGICGILWDYRTL